MTLPVYLQYYERKDSLEKKLDIGGEAKLNGLTLKTDDYSVNVEYESNEIYLTEEKLKSTESWITKIPFVRGILFLFIFLIKRSCPLPSKIFSLYILITFYLSLIFFSNKIGVVLVSVVTVVPLSLIILIALLASKYPKYIDLYKFHGAEHILVTSYEEDRSDLDGIDPFHYRCGSSYITMYLFFLIVFLFISSWIPISTGIFIHHALVSEISFLMKKIKFLRRLNIFGVLLQKKIALKPDRKHLLVGGIALNRLLELEKSKEVFVKRSFICERENV